MFPTGLYENKENFFQCSTFLYFGNKITEYSIDDKLDNNKYFQDFLYDKAVVIPLIKLTAEFDKLCKNIAEK
ncbi:hypothetical protein [Wolbachia endosymbiont of Ctenocephalides felis wCfeJ]|uniref:hypothetical protein n=1 Tax=Wolbachia endosymbiont of Ctenocephalides felis wCfeJ TaxID=2732594 RepID=UPI00144633C2|nr:hypothetical protein [Wolbachia endosymbiont of Ctenocephalides felis wCfeJ]WCR58326.1 MAG: hypothetical protein PG980_000798 [Wolbachia endosymbiont of Ctenocephalides felis wCfeJ]